MSNEQAVRQIVDGMPGLILTATAAGATEFANQQLLAYFGKTLEEALATSMVLPESAVTYAVDDPEHAIRVGASKGTDESSRRRRANGSFRSTLASVCPFADVLIGNLTLN
jgi:PAS domain-containing protein